MEGRVFETFSKNQKIFKIPKMPKIVPKNVQRSFEHVLGLFFRNIFLPSVPWRFESSKCFQKSKIFQNSKNNRKCSPKVSERVLNMFWGNFSEKFFAQCSMEGRVFETFSKNQKIFKIPKMPKILPKMSKRVLNMFWGTFFGRIFLPSVPWRDEPSKCFLKKLKNFQNSKSAQNPSQNVQTCFEHVLG